jgi:hypothetical protein
MGINSTLHTCIGDFVTHQRRVGTRPRLAAIDLVAGLVSIANFSVIAVGNAAWHKTAIFAIAKVVDSAGIFIAIEFLAILTAPSSLHFIAPGGCHDISYRMLDGGRSKFLPVQRGVVVRNNPTTGRKSSPSFAADKEGIVCPGRT